MDDLLTIYPDVCCLNRPFDDLSQERVRKEAEAVLYFMNGIRRGRWKGIISETTFLELEETPNPDRKAQVFTLLEPIKEVIPFTPMILGRAVELERLGFKETDALHLACAEKGNVDLFLTTDDKLLRNAKRHPRTLSLRVENPLTWMEEVRER